MHTKKGVFLAAWTAVAVLTAAVGATAFPGRPGSGTATVSAGSGVASQGIVVAGRGGKLRSDQRGSSAEVYGGSSADRYGGSSADRNGVAGERDVRVHGRPKRPPKEREPKKPVDGEQQDDEQAR